MKLKLDKNWIYIPLLVIFIFISISNNQQGAIAQTKNKNYSIASGNNGGTYYYIGAGQSKILSDNTELSISTQSTSGSPVENMTLVSNDSSMLGIVTEDGFSYAINGDTERGFKAPLNNLAALQMGHTAYLYAISLQDSNIDSFDDMVGKTVAVPPVGSSTYYMALAIMEAYGCTEDNSRIIPMSSSEQADAIKDKAIDVAFVAGGIPQATVTDLDNSLKINFLSLDQDKQDELADKYPYWHSRKIPDNSYKNQTSEVICLTVKTMLVCNTEIDNEVAHEITKTLNENTDELTSIHSSGKEWNLEETLDYVEDSVIKFHPGALEYYNEVLSSNK